MRSTHWAHPGQQLLLAMVADGDRNTRQQAVRQDPTSQGSSAGGEDDGGGRGGDVGAIVPPSDRQLWCGSNRPVNRLAQRASNRAAAASTPGQ